MNQFKRFAVYYAPRPGPFATLAQGWLGRDPDCVAGIPQPMLPGLPAPPAELTVEPRRYGFHGTLRAPFRPGDGISAETIEREVAALAARLAPALADGVVPVNMDGFLALVPDGDASALVELGAAVVEGTDALRAPLTEAEIARRRPGELNARQIELLHRWGYPFVMDAFHFHLTLTDRLAADWIQPALTALTSHFAPVLPRPFAVEDLCLFGEDAGGRFHLLHRYALTG